VFWARVFLLLFTFLSFFSPGAAGSEIRLFPDADLNISHCLIVVNRFFKVFSFILDKPLKHAACRANYFRFIFISQNLSSSDLPTRS